jgi:copper chaperone CopZ
MKVAHLAIEGMTCEHCVNAVEGALRARPGVASALVNLPERMAQVEYDEGAVSPEQLAEVVCGEGYEAHST